jgi:hypothetical protein
MKQSLVWLLILLPCFLKAQERKEDYTIYSRFLKIYQEKKTTKFCFVAEDSLGWEGTHFSDFINEFRENLEYYLQDDDSTPASKRYLDDVSKELNAAHRIDTAWIPLIDKLCQTLDVGFILKNKFQHDLQIHVIHYDAEKYFIKNENSKPKYAYFKKSFHSKLPLLLIRFSQIVSDGSRAIFYFSTRCNCESIEHEGQLVLFYRKNSKWKFLGTIGLWHTGGVEL